MGRAHHHFADEMKYASPLDIALLCRAASMAPTFNTDATAIYTTTPYCICEYDVYILFEFDEAKSGTFV